MANEIQTLTTTSGPTAPRRRRRWPWVLGGLALLFVIVISLVPMLAERYVRYALPDSFNEASRGRMKVEGVSLGWFSEGHVEDIRLSDPDGKHVLSGSADFPSMWSLVRSGGTRLGKVRVELEADLVADDQGRTNLERALEARDASTSADEPAPAEPGAPSDTSPLERLAGLELDFELVARSIRWSDAETRRLGQPFELRNLAVRAAAAPGAPLTCRATAEVAADKPGRFEVDLRLDRAGGATFTTLAATGKIENFSSALVDGLAGQRGKLRELLGPSFTLTFAAHDVTRERGTLELSFAGESATRVELAGRSENGRLVSGEAPFLEATIALPRAYLAAHLVPALPAGSTLDFGADPKPWSVRIDELDCALPDASQTSLAALEPLLSQATARLSVELASPIGFENEETRRAFGGPVALERTTLQLTLAPGAPPGLACATTVRARGASPVTAQLSSADLWSALASQSTPHFDGKLRAADLPVAALDAALGLDGRLAAGLGERLTLDVLAQDAGADRGRVELALRAPRFELAAPLVLKERTLITEPGQELRLRLDAPPQWLESWFAGSLPEELRFASDDGHVLLSVRDLALPLPPEDAAPKPAAEGADALAFLRGRTSATFALELPAVRVASAQDAALRIFGGQLKGSLSAAGACELAGEFQLDSSRPGTAALTLRTADVWSWIGGAGSARAPLDAELEVAGLAPALLDAFAGPGERIAGLCGGPLELTAACRDFDLQRGTFAVHVSAPQLALACDGRIEAGVLRGGKDGGFLLRARPAAAFVQRELAAVLPAGMELALLDAPAAIELRATQLEWPLPSGARAPAELPALLEPLRAELQLDVAGLRFANEATRAAGLELRGEQLALAVKIEPSKPLSLSCALALVTRAQGGAEERGRLELQAALERPWALLAKPAEIPPLDLRLELSGLPARALDGFVGGGAWGSELLGEQLALSVAAQDFSLEGGELTLEFKSPNCELRCAAKVERGFLLLDGERACELVLRPTQAWLEARCAASLPPGARLALPASGAAWTLSVPALRLPVDLAAPEPLRMLSRSALVAELRLPELSYADAKTAASGKPVVIRGLSARVELAPEAEPTLRLQAAVEAEPPGELKLDLRALDPLGLLGEEAGLDRFRVACELRGRQLPTALIDALAQQEGLLVEALGTRVEARCTSAGISLQQGQLSADLESDLHSLHVEGEMREGSFHVTKQEGLHARVGLGPVMNERVVGRLLPMLVELRKPAGAEPSVLAVDTGSFPLDGNLRALDATVRLDLGEVTYALLPGLDQVLGKVVQLKPTRVPPIEVPIQKGVASYKDLKLELGGQPCTFQGSFDLVDLTLKLDTEIPLKALGKKFSKELDRVREYVSPDLKVPIEIRGTWKKPKFGVRDDFVKKVLADAAGKGLGDLLEDLFKKKKD